ncbi:MAG TPA: acyl-CoA desaturase [Candidatus Nanoarchaeia archaeon]|nr:acyl-CoA desaturase [Candidatus Nanoarchaeia archaeon]
MTNEYAALSKLVHADNLLARQPVYYLRKVLSTLTLLAFSIAILLWTDNIWFQLLNAAFLSFILGQIGFLSHDASHHQIFKDPKKNVWFGLISWGLFLGISASSWTKNHNKHHSHPNHADEDPDLELPVVAFFDAQAKQKQGFQRWMVKYQAYFFPFLFMLLAFKMHKTALVHVFSGNAQRPLTEGLLLLGYYGWYLGLIFTSLPFWTAILFLLVNHALTGLYMSSVFAPNHKGMPIIKKNSTLSYLRKQVLTARNVKPNFLTDLLYGGLNYQIEHHLYTTMPRNNLRKARNVVRDFCARRGIPYHETSVLRSYWEIFRELRRVSATI